MNMRWFLEDGSHLIDIRGDLKPTPGEQVYFHDHTKDGASTSRYEVLHACWSITNHKVYLRELQSFKDGETPWHELEQEIEEKLPGGEISTLMLKEKWLGVAVPVLEVTVRAVTNRKETKTS
jgi:hypothetical protein